MMQLEIGGTRHPIAAGETIIGSDPGAAVVLGGEGVRPRHAILRGSAAGAAIRAAAAEAEVLVNGVRVGGDPTPVLHGDKIRIGAHELLAVDPARAGSTQLFDSGAFTDLMPARPAAGPGGAAINGRVVCLTDGREYKVRDVLVFGRDAGSDVVVTGNEVSRRHAEIRPGPEAYVLTDLSANGTLVNGVRIRQTHRLARADVIRIGNDEFRFYADAPESAQPPPGAAERLADTLQLPLPAFGGRRPTPAAGTGVLLASLLVRTGALRGRRLPVRAPEAVIGRSEESDIAIADPSVSATHAKLRRREDVWSLTDCGSATGTFVDGEPVTDETPLGPGATLRFGEVSVLFDPLDDAAVSAQVADPEAAGSAPGGVEPGGAAPGGVAPGAARDNVAGGTAEPESPPRPRPVRPPRAQVPTSRGAPTWAILLVLAALAAIAYLLLA